MLKVENKIVVSIALRVALASLLAILIAYTIGWTNEMDFAFFAPFSVYINMLMFPYQSPKHWIMIERLAGVLLGYALAMLSLILFPTYPI